MRIELFGGPLDGVQLDHDESERDIHAEPWLGIVWVEDGEKYGAVYEYRGNGYAMYHHEDLEH